MERDAAIARIMELVTQLNPDVNAINLEFYATKLVLDVLDYCHRTDFPEALIYSAAGALVTQFTASSGSDSPIASGAPISEIKMDDTTFKFAVAEKETSSDIGASLFDALKPRLNLYRKVVGL